MRNTMTKPDADLSPEAMERLAKALEDPERLRCGDWYCHRFDGLDHDGTLAAATHRAASAKIAHLKQMLDLRAAGPAERYWEARARAEVAENARLAAERDGLLVLLREGADLLADAADALRSGLSIGDVFSPGPEDQHAVDAINEIEGWIRRGAALQPLPGDTQGHG